MLTLLLIFFPAIRDMAPCAVGVSQSAPAATRQADTHFLESLLDQVDLSKDPTVRVFLRLKIAAYLRKDTVTRLTPQHVAAAALADLHAHEEEIPPLYAEQFRGELLIILRGKASAGALIPSGENGSLGRSSLQLARSLILQEGKADDALGIARGNISGSKSLDALMVPFLHLLDRSGPAQVPTLLDEIMSAEESRPGFLSASDFFTLKHLFLRRETPPALQRRYLKALVKAADAVRDRSTSIVDLVAILTNVLPEVEKMSPDLYAAATHRRNNLLTQLPAEALERLAANKRVSESADPLAQSLAEADATNSQSLRDELLTNAARLALERGQTRTAVELVDGLRGRNADKDLWCDQFIGGAVSSALDKRNVGDARYAALYIRAVAIRSAALQQIALNLQKSGDAASARETLKSALKLVESSDDTVCKATALLDLSETFMKMNEEMAGGVMSAAVKTINRWGTMMQDTSDADARLRNAEDAMKLAYRLGPAFQALAALDEFMALALAKEIRPQGLRLVAMLGAHTGSVPAERSRRTPLK